MRALIKKTTTDFFEENAANIVMASRVWLTSYIFRLLDSYFSLVYFSGLKYIFVRPTILAPKMHHSTRLKELLLIIFLRYRWIICSGTYSMSASVFISSKLEWNNWFHTLKTLGFLPFKPKLILHLGTVSNAQVPFIHFIFFFKLTRYHQQHSCTKSIILWFALTKG